MTEPILEGAVAETAASRPRRSLPLSPRLALELCVGAFALIVPVLLVGLEWKFTLCTALIYAIAATNVSVLLGQAGMISLLTTTQMGLGALIASDITAHGGSWGVGLMAAVAACALAGALVGLVGNRLRGITFGIVTLTAGLAANTVLFHDAVLGADPALGALMERPTLGSINLGLDQNYFYFCLGLALIVWAVVAVHFRSRAGRAWRAIRENEVAALSIGVRVGLYRTWAAALGGGIGAVSGVLLLSLQSQSNGGEFTPLASLMLFTVAVAAGVRSVIGILLAGVLFAVLPALLAEWGVSSTIVPLIFAAAVLVSVGDPDGLAGRLRAILSLAGAGARSIAWRR